MWTCERCGEKIEDQFDSCWRCSKPVAKGGAKEAQKRRLGYCIFRGTLETWDELFTEAAQFATEIGPERVVNISHSDSHGRGVVAVWYWKTEDEVEG
jgi:hypothetical protein